MNYKMSLLLTLFLVGLKVVFLGSRRSIITKNREGSIPDGLGYLRLAEKLF